MAAVGGRLPTEMVTSAVPVAPFESVTWRLTLWSPGVAKLVCTWAVAPSLKLPSLLRSHAYEAIVPSGSLDVDVRVTSSPVCGDEGDTPNEAVGGRLPTSTVCEITSVAPLSSVTSRLTVCGPGVAKLALAVDLSPSLKFPSPFRSHAYEEIEPSGSLEVPASKVTWSPVCGVDGRKSNAAVGLRFPTLITWLATSVAPFESVTWRLTL